MAVSILVLQCTVAAVLCSSNPCLTFCMHQGCSEAALLLQGVEPEAGVHYELQWLLNLVINRSPKEEVVALLQERGGLIMEAVRVTEPEEWLLESAREAVPWKEREERRDRSRPADVQNFDWAETFNALAQRLGEGRMGRLGGMWRHALRWANVVKTEMEV